MNVSIFSSILDAVEVYNKPQVELEDPMVKKHISFFKKPIHHVDTSRIAKEIENIDISDSQLGEVHIQRNLKQMVEHTTNMMLNEYTGLIDELRNIRNERYAYDDDYKTKLFNMKVHQRVDNIPKYKSTTDDSIDWDGMFPGGFLREGSNKIRRKRTAELE